MIRRVEPDGSLLIITQPAHAWLTGQLADRWGGEHFPIPEPRDALILAAYRHDDGWAEWEAAPRLRPDGRPPNFTEMHIDDHLAIWRRGLRWIGASNPFAALLVALHATALYRSRLATRPDPPEVHEKIVAFQAETGQAVRRWIDELRDNPRYAYALPDGPAPLGYAPLRLLQAWDLISLLVCGGLRQARQVEDVPTAEGPVTLEISPLLTEAGQGQVERFTVSPWPFAQSSITICMDARRLPQAKFTGTADFRAALQAAPWQPLCFCFEQT